MLTEGSWDNMTYDEARVFLEKAASYGSRPGLETITELLKRLDKPQDKLRIIHIAGTNGKGSTAAFIAAILAAAGYKTGRYISPAVFDYREKIQISHKCSDRIINEYITEEGICGAIAIIKAACEGMVKDGFHHPTVFEIETVMAFLYLTSEQVDFAIIETGMGGRLDATNVAARPVCSVITSISMDHMQYLGDTLEKIAREKAGIIKGGVPVITGNTNPAVIGVLEEACLEMNTKLTVVSKDNAVIHSVTCEGTAFNYSGHIYNIKLLGEHQVTNALIAVEAVTTLQREGYEISQDAIYEGLSQASWSGRFEILAKNPYFIIDGAHNEDAAIKLRKAIQDYFSGRRLIFIMGIFADKEYKKVLEIMAPLAGMIITITPPSSRALSSKQLAEEAAKYFKGTIIDAGAVSEAIDCACENSESCDVIIAFGSLSFLQEVTSFLNRKQRDQIR
jgi:dihydrofolate synthase/folylpolyglutamate synthase